MSEIDIQIGNKIRNKRRKLGITQAHFSKKLSISPSYLNLMESGKRKISMDLLIKIANELNVNLSDISKKTDTSLYQNLMDLLGDNLFENLDITNFDVKQLVNTNPLIAKALVKLGDNYKKKNQEIVTKVENISGKFIDNRKNSFPGEVVADFIQENENNFHKLEDFATSIFSNPFTKQYDEIKKIFLVSDYLNLETKKLYAGAHVTQLEATDIIDQYLNTFSFPSEESKKLSKVALLNYAGAAIIMPYKLFYEECIKQRYDVELLQNTFAVSFEQVAHRLTCLQNPKMKGIPFHMLRADTQTH